MGTAAVPTLGLVLPELYIPLFHLGSPEQRFQPIPLRWGCLRCPCRDGGRVCLHLCGHDAKHLLPSEQLGRRSNYLFQDKNNSSNLGAAASFPAHGETRIILARGGERTPQCGGAQACVPPAAAPVWDLNWGGGGWSREQAPSPRQHGAQLVGKTVYLPKNAVFQRRRREPSGLTSHVGRAE